MKKHLLVLLIAYQIEIFLGNLFILSNLILYSGKFLANKLKKVVIQQTDFHMILLKNHADVTDFRLIHPKIEAIVYPRVQLLRQMLWLLKIVKNGIVHPMHNVLIVQVELKQLL